MRDARLEKVARRQMPLVGVNVNVDPAPPAHRGRSRRAHRAGGELLRPIRLPEAFEALCVRERRRRAARVACCSSRMSRGEDPAEAADAFAAGGFEVVSTDARHDADALDDAFARSGAQVACLVAGCGRRDVAAADRAGAPRSGRGMVVMAAASDRRRWRPPAVFDAVLVPDTDMVVADFGSA